MILYTKGNKDDITEAIHGLDIFTKNWCMNCEEVEKQNDLPEKVPTVILHQKVR